MKTALMTGAQLAAEAASEISSATQNRPNLKLLLKKSI
jgi:hypothetical protein